MYTWRKSQTDWGPGVAQRCSVCLARARGWVHPQLQRIRHTRAGHGGAGTQTPRLGRFWSLAMGHMLPCSLALNISLLFLEMTFIHDENVK